VIAHWRSRGLCPSRGGPTADILEWPPHRVGGLHCGLSIVTPPACACVRVSPIAHSGERGWLVQRDVSLFLGLTAGIYESPAHRVGRLDLFFRARHPAGGCAPNTSILPARAVARYLHRGLCPFSWGRPLVVASRRHTRWAGLTCFFELVTPPVGARRTRAHRPGGPLRAIIPAGCVPLLGRTAGFF